MYKVIQKSRIRLLIALQSEIQTVESRIQTSAEESGIHERSGIRNPCKLWNPESKERNPESKEKNPESRECMDYLTWGDYLLSSGQSDNLEINGDKTRMQSHDLVIVYSYKVSDIN
jgi:hypothetical protein